MTDRNTPEGRIARLCAPPTPDNPHGYLPETQQVKTHAEDVVAWIHDEDPRRLHTMLTLLAGHRPAALAQIAMTLAAWVDPEEDGTVRRRRVEAITDPPPPRPVTRIGGAA